MKPGPYSRTKIDGMGENAKKQKLLRATAFLNGFLFLMGGFSFINDGKLLFGSIQLLASVLNILSGLNVSIVKKWGRALRLGIGFLNVMVAATVAVDYYQSDTQYIQYAWAFAAIMNLIALFIQWRKET